MNRWRCAFVVISLALIGVPLAMPFFAVGRVPSAWTALAETERLALLARNTLLLVAGTLAVAAPLGALAAVLLHRTDLPLRRMLRLLIILTLFIPLPLFASGWQAALGSGGWLPLHFWTTPSPSDPDISSTGILWKPWAQGLPAAIWIHAVAGLPWIILLVGQGLNWVERELEEDALTAAPPWWVLMFVTLPRCRVALAASLIWVGLQTAGEITVADMLQVRTFAEEVYNQFVRPAINDSTPTIQAAVARALVVSLPGTIAAGLILWWGARRWERRLPPLDRLAQEPWIYPLGWIRWPVFLLTGCAVCILFGIPVGSLVWKTGRTVPPPTLSASESPKGNAALALWATQSADANPPAPFWSARTFSYHLGKEVRVHKGLLWDSLWQAFVVGALCAALAWVMCWLASGSAWFRMFILVLVVVAWCVPGPVIGIGLKEVIRRIMDATESEVLQRALYFGPSPLPVIWVNLIRFFPAAIALSWPVVRLVPGELLESARIDGASPAYEWRRVVAPLTLPAFLRAALAVAILSLGELSAGKLVETPGSTTFAHEVFTRMHYGVTNDLAALCLLLLSLVLLGGIVVGLMNHFWAEVAKANPNVT